MESPEIRHERFRKAQTAGIRVLTVVDKTFEENQALALYKIVLHYNNEVRNGNINILDVFFTILCFEYQERIKSKEKYTPENFDYSFVEDITQLLQKNENYHEKTMNFLLDILVLEIVLYGKNDQIKLFISTLMENNEITMKIISSLIDAIFLNSYIHNENGGNQFDFFQISKPMKNILKPVPDADSNYFALLNSIIHKLIITFSGSDVINFLWSSIMAEEHGDERLKILTIALDNILIVKNTINIEFICKNTFWHLICSGLSSDIEEQRKQGLYLLKKSLDYVENEKVTLEKNSLIPFVGCQNDGEKKSIQQLKTQFLLILECLEEKQTHLVIPVLDNLHNLVESSLLHDECGNCFDRMYLHCIFKRIIKHKTNGIVKEGLKHLLEMDPAMFDDEFLMMLIESLNNTSLYGATNVETLPEVVEKLSKLFIKAENAKVNLINTFICKASTYNWSYIPFFYVIAALNRAVEQIHVKRNIWGLREFRAFVSLIRKNIKTQTPPLREIVNDNTSRIFGKCIGKDVGLESVTILFALGKFHDYYAADNLFSPPVVLYLNRLNYSDNSSVWSSLIDYVGKNVSQEDAILYLHNSCAKLCDCTENNIDIENFALVICVLIKAGRDFSTLSVFPDVLNQVFEIVSSVQENPSVNITILVKIVEFFACLKKFAIYCDLKIPKTSEPSVNDIISPYTNTILCFLVNNLQSLEFYSHAKIYITCFQYILHHRTKWNYNCEEELKQLIENSWKIIFLSNGNVNVQFWYALHIVTICTNTGIYPNVSSEHQGKTLDALMTKRELKLTAKSDDNGQMIFECYETISQLIFLHIVSQYWTVPTTGMNLILLRYHNLLENGGECVIPWVVRAVHHLHYVSVRRDANLISNDDTEALTALLWKVLLDSKKNHLFWMNAIFLIRLTMSAVDKQFPSLPNTAINHLKNWILNTENTLFSKFVFAFLTYERRQYDEGHHEHFWLSIESPFASFLDCNITKNDQKNEAHIYNLFQNNLGSVKNYLKRYTDINFRLHCLITIINKFGKLPIDSIVHIFIMKFREFEGKRYFADSQIHRQKHRIMQLLLLSYKYWNESTIKFVYENICNFIVYETDQPTVRVMQQWLLMLIYIKNPILRDQIWELLQEGKNKRPGSITSIATIIYHVSQNISGDERRNYIKKAVQQLLPCCLSQQFIVRLYSQVILSKFFHQIRDLEFSLEYLLLENALQESMQYGNFKNNSDKLSDDFFFTSFDPIHNYDIQTIFYDLPRLLNMSMDECIHPNNFKGYENDIKIKIKNPENKLTSINISHEQSKINTSTADTTANADKNIQKKLIPEKPMNPMLENDEFHSTVRSKNSELIVVASLIDGGANLGGLARTAEIFGAKELVLSSLISTQSREFQALSVSSEKWLTLSEVKSHKLRDFLLEKKSIGWNLVGAEQTTQSINLQEMKFNKKTLLVLGNEKTGIPANLIPLMDVCVEIPQAGVVRSLNVHVTGAILMWHYAKQYIF